VQELQRKSVLDWFIHVDMNGLTGY
jgi:hypothetical protein